jgi:hypothetical protein
MNKALRSRKRRAKQSARLGAYLAAGVGASMVATSTTNAAIIVLDLGPSGPFNILGLGGGVDTGDTRTISDFPVPGGMFLTISNGYYNVDWGLQGTLDNRPMAPGEYPLGVFAAGGDYTTPTNFKRDEVIDSSVAFGLGSLFRYGTTYSAPDFGSGSYMGFRFRSDSIEGSTNFNYGWLEVTWNSATDEFHILGGAYESDPNVGIAAGAVPEPSTYALLALAAGGGAYLRWRRRRDAAQKEAA